MALLARFRSLLRNLRRRQHVDDDLNEEIHAYLDLASQENEARGMDPHSARRSAQMSLGSVEQVKDGVRDVRAGALLESVVRDLRFAIRTLMRSPAFTITAVLSIALGVGANTAVFTLVNTLLLKPLPVENPSTLAVIYGAEKGASGGSTQVSRLNFESLRERTRSFSILAATAGPTPIAFSRGAEPVGVFTEFVTAGYFPALGIRPALGRFFTGEEDRTPGASPVAVISYGTWQRRLGADLGVVGQTVRLNGLPFTIVGVAPNGFKGLTTFFGPEVWLPSMMAESVLGDEGRAWLREREENAFNIVGRLRAGVSRDEARTELRELAAGLEVAFPAANAGRTLTVQPITEASLFPGLRNAVLAGAVFLLGIVGLVLLIACSNVANLLMARATARRHEIAVRLAMGAGRARIVRQLLTESIVLACAGGAAGVAVGALVKELLWARRPALIAESLVEPRLDAAVFAYSLAVSILAGIALGLLPALQATEPSVSGTLQEEGRSGGGRRRLRAGNVLVTAQVCLSTVCLVVAGLGLRSVQSIYASDPGFETERLAIVTISPREAGYSEARSEAYFNALVERVAGLPGIERVSLASNPLLFGGPSRGIEIPGLRPTPPGERPRTSIVNAVQADYFRTVGLAMKAGRAFTSADDRQSLPVAVVNEAFATSFFPDGGAIGRRFRFSRDLQDREIVGIVRTSPLVFLGEPPQPCVYVPLAQSPQGSMNLYVRTLGKPSKVLGILQAAVRQIDDQVVPQNPTTIRQLMDNNLWITRFVVALFAALGLLGLALASVGLYGVLAYTVGNRRREIGIRLALGADRKQVARMILVQGLGVVGAGTAAGLVLALLITQVLGGVLYGVSTTDALSYASASTILFVVASLACYLPARRAGRIDPAIALREG